MFLSSMGSAQVYILFSRKWNKFYIGFTTFSADIRLKQHSTKFYPDSYTAGVHDWALYFVIDCLSEQQARKIEAHIKRMKSSKFIENLKKYPEIVNRLLTIYR